MGQTVTSLVGWTEYGDYSQGSEKPLENLKVWEHHELIYSLSRSFWLQRLDKSG